MPNCRQCNTGFEITRDDLKVLHKMTVPEPTLCPDCRQQRRIAFRNDQNYYRNKCNLCKKDLISIYSPDKPFPVLCHECFWSDKWDPLEYGQDFDFSRPFFEQYAEMRAKVPRLAIFNTNSENSEFTVHSSRNRNCYMGSSLVDCEDVYYSDWAIKCRDCMDLLFCTGMELCYECVDSLDCTNSNYLEYCMNTSESFFASDCRGSKRLVGCVSLRNRKNHILNQPADKEECYQTIQRLKNDPHFFKDFKKKFEDLKASKPKCASWMVNSENCSGNYIFNSKNAHFAFNAANAEDGRYIYDVIGVKDAYDATRNSGSEFVYESKGAVDLKFAKFCNLCYHCDNIAYCDNCQNSSFCFGCMGLKRHKNCVLNKQYSADEYRLLVPKIIEYMKQTGEYGEFFPVSMSLFGYNETKAQEFFPLEKAEVIKRGWNWSDYESPVTNNIRHIPAAGLPGRIQEVTDDILQMAITCEVTGRPFKITARELKFYRQKGLPIPHISPRQRHLVRRAMKNHHKLYDRKCAECGAAIITTYPPESTDKVICSDCYLKTVY